MWNLPLMSFQTWGCADSRLLLSVNGCYRPQVKTRWENKILWRSFPIKGHHEGDETFQFFHDEIWVEWEVWVNAVCSTQPVTQEQTIQLLCSPSRAPAGRSCTPRLPSVPAAPAGAAGGSAAFHLLSQGGLIAQPGPAEPQCLLGIAARKGLLSSSNVCSPSRGCFWVNILSFELCKLSLRREKAISPFPLTPLLVEVAIHIYKNVLQWFHSLPPAETKLLQFWAERIGSVLSFGNFVIVQIFIHFKTKTCNNSYILVILKCDLRTQCVILPKSNFAKRRGGGKKANWDTFMAL